MPQVDIIQLLKQDGGEKFYPVTHVDAVIGLKDSSFFEKVDDGEGHISIKLKSEYTGLWADGWIAAGGIGSSSGGGGGLIQTVYTWSDMQEMSNAPEDNTASAFNAKTVYEIYKMLQAGGLDGGGYLKESGGGFFLTSSGEKILLKGEGHSLASLSDVSIYNPAVNDLLVWSGYSWVNVPQSSVRPDLSGYVTTVTFNSTIANLQEQIDALENYFEVDGSGNITLKSPHQNLWVPGWLAAGGIGSGGGGGGGGTNLSAVWDSLTKNPPLDEYANTKIHIDHIPLSDLAVWLATTETDPTVPSWAKQTNPSFYIGTTQVLTSPNDQALTGILSINATSLVDSASRIVWEPNAGGEGIGAWHFYGNIYASGWVASGGIGVGGGSYTPGTGIDITNNEISLKTASTSVLGGVKVDGTTITISDGVISAVGGGGGSVTVVDNLTSSSATSALSANQGKTLKSIIDAGYVFKGFLEPEEDGTGVCDYPVCFITGKSGRYSAYSNISLSLSDGELALLYRAKNSSTWNYVKTKISVSGGGGGTVTSVGMSVPSEMSVSPSQITSSGTFAVTWANQTKNKVLASPSSGSGSGAPSFRALVAADIPDLSDKYVTLDTDQNNISGSKTFTKPLTVNAAVGDSYIDIGNARLVYDSGTNALHITKKSGTQAVGLFADGFVAAGGVSGQTTSSFVDLESNQEIGGNKTFNGNLSVEGSAYFDMGITMSGDLDIDSVTISTDTVDGATGLTVGKNAKFTWVENGVTKSVSIKNLLDRIVALGG